MSGVGKQERDPTAPNTESAEAYIGAKHLTENQKKKRRKRLAKKRQLQEFNIEKRSGKIPSGQERANPAAREPSAGQQALGPGRAHPALNGVEEASLMTIESDRSSISGMPIWTGPHSQVALQQYSSEEGARPPKRQRTDAQSADPQIHRHRGSLKSAEQAQQHSLPQRAGADPMHSHLEAASSASQHSMCQDAAAEACEGHSPSKAYLPETVTPAFSADSPGHDRYSTGQPLPLGQRIADFSGHKDRECPTDTLVAQQLDADMRESESRAAKQFMRTDMSHAAAVIGSALPSARGSPEEQQVPGSAQCGVSKREIKRQGFVPVHGNYRRYYGYRIGQAFDEDPRLKVMEKPWFQNRNCLDIGCNEGMVTLGLVTRFGTASMLGVDIDQVLISKACRHLREEHSRATAELARVSHTRRHLLSGSPDAEAAQLSQNAERKAASAALQGLSGTRFQQGNFLELGGVERGTYDTILCLSMTKWVHLNGGDAALHALLGRIYDLLAPGGRLILEPQPWSSYQAAVHKPGMRERLQPLSSLYLRPGDLPHYATQQFRFSFVRQLRVPENAKGFDRPMYLFQKIA